MKYFKQVGVMVVIAAVSFSAGKFFSPAEVVVKEVENKKTDTTRDTKKKETVLPDGTRIIETDTTTKRTTDSNKAKDTTVTNRPAYRVNAIYFPKVGQFQDQNGILDIQKHMFGELYLGVSVSTQKTIGVSISIGF